MTPHISQSIRRRKKLNKNLKKSQISLILETDESFAVVYIGDIFTIITILSKLKHVQKRCVDNLYQATLENLYICIHIRIETHMICSLDKYIQYTSTQVLSHVIITFSSVELLYLKALQEPKHAILLLQLYNRWLPNAHTQTHIYVRNTLY